MMTVILKHNQSLLDISIQAFGILEACMETAFANDISITDELIEGGELELPEFKNEQKEIVNFYNKNQIKSVTALSNADFTIVEIESCNLCNCFK